MPTGLLSLWLFVVSVASNLLALALPLALLQVYDRVLPTSQYGTATTLFVVVVVAMVLDGFLRLVRSRAVARASIVQEHGQTIGLARDLLGADMARLRSVDRGVMRDGFNAITQSRDLGGPGAHIPLFDLPFAVILVGLVWFIGGRLVLVPIAVLAPFSLAALYAAQKQRSAALARADAEQAFMSRMGDLLTGLVDSKGFGHAGKLMNRLRGALRTHAEQAERFERPSSLLTDLSQVASLATTVAITTWGALVVIDTSFTTGGLAACSVLGGRAVGTGLNFFSSIARHGAARAARDRVAAIRDALGSSSDVVSRGTDDAGDIELNSVVLRRAGANVPATSARIAAGSTVLLRADRSASELLLMLAIAGLARPDAGAIVPIRRTAFVPGHPAIFRGTILDNLTGWDISRASAARGLALDLGLAPLIDRLPDGIQTETVGGITSELSAGTVKRIALVCALASDTPVIALEYPEVDLDVDGKRRLLQILARRGDRTTLFLTTADPDLAAIATQTIRVPSTAGVLGAAA
jgi:ABC-type bacteriocin/lantibiotic exporter with double-glycine peptidase domain